MNNVVVNVVGCGQLDPPVFDPAHIMNLSPTAVSYWDRDLHCRYANQACVDWFGIDPEILVGSALENVLDLLRLDAHFALLDAVLQGERRSIVHRFHEGLAKRDGFVQYVPDVRGHLVSGVLIQISATPPVALFDR